MLRVTRSLPHKGTQGPVGRPWQCHVAPESRKQQTHKPLPGSAGCVRVVLAVSQQLIVSQPHSHIEGGQLRWRHW